jgi:hypothetical protein
MPDDQAASEPIKRKPGRPPSGKTPEEKREANRLRTAERRF